MEKVAESSTAAVTQAGPESGGAAMEDDSDEEGDEDVGPTPSMSASIDATANAPPVPIIDAPRITIHEDD